MPQTSVLSIAFDKQGNTWFGTNGDGLVRLDASQTNWTVYTTANSTLPSNCVYSVAVDKKGVVWVATAAGIVQIKNNIWTVFGAGFAQVPLAGLLSDVAIDSSNRK